LRNVSGKLTLAENMTYEFYADKTDKLSVLDFIFNQTDLQVFDLASPYGQKIGQYKSCEEISAKFDLINGDKVAITFQLWTPRHKGEPVFRKVSLDPNVVTDMPSDIQLMVGE
jgi:hypothetical protein